MDVNNSQINPSFPSSAAKETQLEAVKAIPTNGASCGEVAKAFTELTDIKMLVETAQVVAGLLKSAEDGLNDWDLPCDLTPLHIACLAGDMELLQLALKNDVCRSRIDQHTASCSTTTTSSTPDSITITTTISVTAAIAANAARLQDPGEIRNILPIAMNHDTALHFALLTGWNEGTLTLMEALSKLGKLENTTNDKRNSLFSLAASHSSLEVVRELCSHFMGSENYRAHLFHKSEDQKTLLHCAVEQDDHEVFRYLQREQMETTDNINRDLARKHGYRHLDFPGRLPISTRDDKDRDGNTPEELIALKIGLDHIQKLRDNPRLLEQKRYNGCDSLWEEYYLQDITFLIDPVSWIPLWKKKPLSYFFG
ncbi:ankyrin repeat domain-containing protein [Endozoicomonas acroporae]|uniref:ankyrin repeat domain-containing protein n=1 Tax=Endozoicomonas acroporae TaxID=1701104 RepID=UPI0013D2FA57|nr:ankyrin repeat domain-containing protein [Endozoicomonas acroporae]